MAIKKIKTNRYSAVGKIEGSYRYTRWVQVGGGKTPVPTWVEGGRAETKRVGSGRSLNKSLQIMWAPKSYRVPTGMRTVVRMCNDRPLLPDACDSDGFTSLFK